MMAVTMMMANPVAQGNFPIGTADPQTEKDALESRARIVPETPHRLVQLRQPTLLRPSLNHVDDSAQILLSLTLRPLLSMFSDGPTLFAQVSDAQP